MLKSPMFFCNKSYSLEADVNYPTFVSPKLDGVRGVLAKDSEGILRLYARSMKLIPNPYIRKLLEQEGCHGLDGEIVVGKPNLSTTFNTTTSFVRREKDDSLTHLVTYYVFDAWHLQGNFSERYSWLRKYTSNCSDRIKIIPHQKVYNADEVLEKHSHFLSLGFEGTVIRDPHAFYKQGRTTVRERSVYRVKEWSDSEAEIIDVFEAQENTNKAFKNELGLQARSSAKEGLVGKSLLGGFVVRDLKTGIEFSIGSFEGLTSEDRSLVWAEKDTYFGQIVKYKYFDHGNKEKPRQPIGIGFRMVEDL